MKSYIYCRTFNWIDRQNHSVNKHTVTNYTSGFLLKRSVMLVEKTKQKEPHNRKFREKEKHGSSESVKKT